MESGNFRLVTLAKMKPNIKARVVNLKMERPSELHEIIAMGVLPGAEIVLVQKFPSYVFRIGQSRFAIDRELAEDIEVKYQDGN